MERASKRSSPPRLNCRLEIRCCPWYTFKRFLRSQSPPSSINLVAFYQRYVRAKRNHFTYFSALSKPHTINDSSFQKYPILTRVRTISILLPRPGVFSRASFWASIALSFSPIRVRKFARALRASEISDSPSVAVADSRVSSSDFNVAVFASCIEVRRSESRGSSGFDEEVASW